MILINTNYFPLLFSEISIRSQSSNLETRLYAKHWGEKIIEYFECFLELLENKFIKYKKYFKFDLRHHVKFHRHCYNVESNNSRNCQVKIFWSDQLMDDKTKHSKIYVVWSLHHSLIFKLWQKQELLVS